MKSAYQKQDLQILHDHVKKLDPYRYTAFAEDIAESDKHTRCYGVEYVSWATQNKWIEYMRNFQT